MKGFSMIRRSFIFICAGFLLIGGWLFFNKYTAKSSDSSILAVGVSSGYAPWSFLNEQGKYEGFDVDIAHAVAQRLGKTAEISDMSSEALWLALEKGKIDIIISPLAITQKRQEKYHMIHYQGGGVKHYPLIFWNEIPKNIHKIEDFENAPQRAVMCVNPGTRQEDFLRQFSFLDILPIGNVVDIIMNLKFGKAVAAMVDPDIVVNLKEQNPELQAMQVPISAEYQSEGNGMAVKKENDVLAQKVSEIVSALRTEGFISSLEQKWNIRRLEE